ncbi:putative UPF0481 protein At3g02645 [Cucurbita pepo subsp. pepo]|uniref:putative UPF0481 protein At3g02645 n=1 Tax=Cucurbita pepo subsp. pepo TaxID=3664 RepID=UPI000C9D521B|nr:putative UPF0481 protein At3g02645 [Cucurbita pepo subsp. pepo]
MENRQIKVDQVNDKPSGISEAMTIEVDQVNDKPCNMAGINEAEQGEQHGRNVVLPIKEMIDKLPPVNEKCSIFRIPKLLHSMNHRAYTPQVISIGPFHHHRKDLLATEPYKLRRCSNFLSRLGNERDSLELLKKNTQTCMKEVRNCYAEPINMNDKEFVNMMVVDGCFVVEFLIENYNRLCPNTCFQTPNNLDLTFHQRYGELFPDLIMLENQVPFFLLESLFDLIPNITSSVSFIELASTFLQCGFAYNCSFSEAPSEKPKHFVDLLSFYFVVPETPLNDINIAPPSITELHEAGVTIKKAENGTNAMNLSFENGIFTIPPLIIYDVFELTMRNLIAFEHFPLGNENKCIQYIEFMDDLISTEKDVNLLVKAGIITNHIGGSDKEVSKLFNNLCKFVELPCDSKFNNTSKALRKHCDGRWNKARASLMHNYCNTPWAFISFCAATLLIILTLAQTIFSGISAFPSKP